VAKGYRPVNRDQQFLMPPDMREWLPARHLVWTLIDVVRVLDTSGFHARCRTGGVGRAGYDPDMMLTLLIYAYSQGIRSSRRIEQLCWVDVACRVICAQDVPDHSTIWRFADISPELVQELFTEVLMLCAAAGMVKLGTITLDGMKIGANASMKANRSEEQLRGELAKLAAAVVAEHRATDEAEQALFGEAAGDELPEELTDPRSRQARLRRALAQVEAARVAEQTERDRKAREYLDRQQDGPVIGRTPVAARLEAARHRLARAIARQQAKIDDWTRRNADKVARTGTALREKPPLPVEEHFTVIRARARLASAEAAWAAWEAKQRPKVRNTTDPDSRLMPTASGFIQGYNPQNVATEDGFILATELTQDTGDVQQAIPMMAAAEAAADLVTGIHSGLAQAAGEQCVCPATAQEPVGDNTDATASARPACPVHQSGIGTIVLDAGYHSEENLTADGPDRLIATGKHHDVERAARDAQTAPTAEPEHPEPAGTGPDGVAQADATQRNAQRLRTPDGITTYRRRGHIAETPHGHIKHNMGIRTLTRRGLPRATAEWKLICATFNLSRLLSLLARNGGLQAA
jgi:transposase